MILWFKRLLCRIFNHKGLVREWVWSHTTPLWLPSETWTCIRCEQEIENPDISIPRFAMPRPMIDMSKYKDICVGVVRMRVRSVDNLQRIEYPVIHD